ncbi:MAG: fibronectin type III domain-containing protein, partial [Thermoplasmatota archaeon]
LIGRTEPGTRSWKDTTVRNGIVYNYRITALNMRGEGNSSMTRSILVGDVPSEPLNLTSVPTGPLELTITWEPPLHDHNVTITGYAVYRKNMTGEYVMISVVEDVRYADSGLETGMEYEYSVSAVNAIGEGGRSNTSIGRALVLPGIVNSIDIVEFDGGVTLNWEAPAFTGGGEITHYDIFRGAEGSPMVYLNSTVDPTYTDVGLTNGEGYLYRVEAYNGLGNGNGTVTIRASPYTYPGGPEIIVHSRGDMSVSLEWAPPELDGGREIIGYVIGYRSLEDESLEIVHEERNLSINIGDLSPGAVYEFMVRAENMRGAGPFSDPVEVMIITLPEKPEDLIEVSTGDGNVTVSWSEPLFDGGVPITGYRVLREGEEIALVDNGTFSVTDQGLVNGVLYSFAVQAVNELGGGEFSDELLAVPLTTPGAPVKLRITQVDGGLGLTWEAPLMDGGSRISAYSVYRKAPGEAPEMISHTPDPGYADDGVGHGVQYSYFVTASNVRGEGDPSDEVGAVFRPAPGAVSNLTVILEGREVHLTWNPPAPAPGLEISGYRVYRKDIDGNDILLGEIGPGDASYVDPATSAGKEYEYTVTAFNSAGESERSESVSIRTKERIETSSLIVPTLATGIVGILIIAVLAVLVVRKRKVEDEGDPAEEIGSEEGEEDEEGPEEGTAQETGPPEIGEMEAPEPPRELPQVSEEIEASAADGRQEPSAQPPQIPPIEQQDPPETVAPKHPQPPSIGDMKGGSR